MQWAAKPHEGMTGPRNIQNHRIAFGKHFKMLTFRVEKPGKVKNLLQSIQRDVVRMKYMRVEARGGARGYRAGCRQADGCVSLTPGPRAAKGRKIIPRVS